MADWAGQSVRPVAARRRRRRSPRGASWSRPMLDKSQADVAYGFVGLTSARRRLLRRAGDEQRARPVRASAAGSATASASARAWPTTSSAASMPGWRAGPLMVRAGVSADNVERTIDSIDAELHGRARRRASRAPKWTTRRSYLIGSLPRQLETNAGIAGFLLSAEVFGLGMDHDVRLPQRDRRGDPRRRGARGPSAARSRRGRSSWWPDRGRDRRHEPSGARFARCSSTSTSR